MSQSIKNCQKNVMLGSPKVQRFQEAPLGYIHGINVSLAGSPAIFCTAKCMAQSLMSSNLVPGENQQKALS